MSRYYFFKKHTERGVQNNTIHCESEEDKRILRLYYKTEFNSNSKYLDKDNKYIEFISSYQAQLFLINKETI